MNTSNPKSNLGIISRGIEFLGTSGTKTPDSGTTSVRISKHCVIDAGNLIKGLGQNVFDIEHIFLTHSHLDHIVDIPFITELFVTRKKTSLKIYGLSETLNDLKSFIFNHRIWPNFEEINLLQEIEKTIQFVEILPDETYVIDDVELTPFLTNHTNGSCGYVIRYQEHAIMFTSDTYLCDKIWNILDADSSIHSLVIDISFPSSYEQLALDSKHLTPALVAQERVKCSRKDITIYPIHIKAQYEAIIYKELNSLMIEGLSSFKLADGAIINFDPHISTYYKDKGTSFFSQILMIGTALSSERNINALLELIISQTRLLTNADGGTLYLYNADKKVLEFKVIQNDTLNTKMGGTGDPIEWEPLPLFDSKGNPNRNMAATVCAHDGYIINIPDVYTSDEYDFSGTKHFDTNTGYYSQTMLVIPLKDHEDNLIGVLQLINKKNSYGAIIPFEYNDEELSLSIGSQAAVALTKQKLINDLEILLESFLHTINVAVEEKSPYTAGHIDRMMDLSLILAKAVHEDTKFFPQKFYTPDELKEIKFSALMHDIGKITTPEHIIDKRTKLETIYDRIETIKLRYEILKRDAQIEYLHSKRSPEDEANLEKTLDDLNEECAFLIIANQGSEFFNNEKIEYVRKIAQRTITIRDTIRPILDEDEVNNLIVQKGTLTEEQRHIINNHATVSLRMLQSLPFPRKLSRVPEIAGGHHEKINGKGYPLGLKGDELSFEARILAIADVFEALSASDRPYKKAKKLSEVMKILFFMAKDEEIDRELLKFFYESGLYLEYAKEVLKPEYIDEVVLNFS